jgi:acetyl/propionyl-CoA carboxylase alpha subunit/acetyl-CoA carboxylase carboxyltransferase component
MVLLARRERTVQIRPGERRVKKVLIANRGEVAIRIARAVAEAGLASVAVFAEDDAPALHRRAADEARPLRGHGPRAYLDIDQLLEIAAATACDAVHPGYGFLSESAEFAARCAEAGLTFIGPSPATLQRFGDKGEARRLAEELGIAVIEGLPGGSSLDEVARFRESLGPGAAIMIKAVSGGGGFGMRQVGPEDDLGAAFEACGREAQNAFGDARLYAERLVRHARHVEVQVIGDGRDVAALGDRDCSIQRRRQKLIELAPCPNLAPDLRARLTEAALGLAGAVRLSSLATIEFLVDAEDRQRAWFIEANPRLQVEHTVTEEVTGLDLVQLQLRLAAGASLVDLGLDRQPTARPGYAIQLRVNLEGVDPDGAATSGGDRLTAYEPPSGPGVRVDGCGYAGYRPSPAYDTLVAKVIVSNRSDDLAAAMAKARRTLAEFRLAGCDNNISLLRALLERREVVGGNATTTFVETHLRDLAARAAELASAEPSGEIGGDATGRGQASLAPPPDAIAAVAPLRGTVSSFEVAVGQSVRLGQTVAVLEAMKMQHLVAAPVAGEVRRIDVAVGQTVDLAAALLFIQPGDHADTAMEAQVVDLERVRPDLSEVIAAHALTLDENRPSAVARRRRTGQRTARQNLDDLFDQGSFREFGALALAAQRRRRDLDDLKLNTPADGLVVGVGEVNGGAFDETRARCVALAYDFTVLAGTQGHFNHKKTDRILEFAEHWKAPVVWFTEGGGGRPGDVDVAQLSASSLDTSSFTTFARLSGIAPRIAINSGRCFAGNAVFFGCADITIATRYSNIGLGGPAMIEGGGLGVFTPDEIGPSDVLYANGALDLLVEDEAAATDAAKRLLGMFQGALLEWTCPDQRTLRHLIPENRVRAYDMHRVIEGLADTETWLELRGGYGPGMITGFLRIEGRPLGVMANNPHHLGGAIDSEAAEKGARFLQLCDAFGVPILSLCDTPGFMVGPQSEATAAVRRGSRLFVTAASLSVPFFTVVTRKGYGLGAQAMAAGDFSAPAMTLAWPTAEFGPMGLEGAVRLGYRKELEAEPDPASRQALFEKLVGRMYDAGKALSVASVVEIDAVIDPAETRAWLLRGLKSCPVPASAGAKRRPFVDVW